MFSYSDYKEIINIIKESGRGCNFRQAQARDKFIIMRHDVEFSVDRAFALSKLELSMDFTSTYFSSGRIIPIIFYPRKTWI